MDLRWTNGCIPNLSKCRFAWHRIRVSGVIKWQRAAALAHLSSLPLQHLNLHGCEELTDAGLAHLSSLPLQHLD